MDAVPVSGDELRLIFSNSHSILLSRTFLFRLPIIMFGILYVENKRKDMVIFIFFYLVDFFKDYTYFWMLTGFFLTFLCLGLANIDEEAKVEKEKLFCWPAKQRCC